MTHPNRMIRRASMIMDACGGTPDHTTLANPTPAVECAWVAYQVGWHLRLARSDLHFLRLARPRGVASLRWHYKAYRRRRFAARTAIRAAGRHLQQAEVAFAELQKVTA